VRKDTIGCERVSRGEEWCRRQKENCKAKDDEETFNFKVSCEEGVAARHNPLLFIYCLVLNCLPSPVMHCLLSH
jgi:hypothetical protein